MAMIASKAECLFLPVVWCGENGDATAVVLHMVSLLLHFVASNDHI